MPWLAGAAIIVAGTIAAYATSLSGAFVLDDFEHIVNASEIRGLWPISPILFGTARPVVTLTLAMNYALGGLATRGYHLLNLAFHVAAALALYSIVTRTLVGERRRGRYAGSETAVATMATLVWAVHPLTTEAVTYVIQRAESLAGLLVLLSLHAVIRGGESPRAPLWNALAVLWCALAMATKPVAVSAPLLVLAYDRVFLAASWRELRERRGWMYLGLASTWAIAVAVSRAAENPTAGFGMPISPIAYAQSQPGVILHYLRLAVWPSPLVFDYGWPVAHGMQVVIPGMVLVALIVVTILVWARSAPMGFLGLWLFVALAPSSSLFPIKDLAAEHRMYLPLIALVVLAVVVAVVALRRWVPRSSRGWVGAGLATVVVATLGSITARRNLDYASEITLWKDVVAKRPDNPRGYYALGAAYVMANQNERAIPVLLEALRRQPDNPAARENLGIAYVHTGRLDEALAQIDAVLRTQPSRIEGRFVRDLFARAHHNRGIVLARLGRYPEAIASYREALRLAPDDPTLPSAAGIAEALLAELDESLRDVPAELGPEFREGPGVSDSSRATLEKSYQRVVDGREAGRIRVVVDLSGPEAHVRLATEGDIPRTALDATSRAVSDAMRRAGAGP